MHQTVPDDPGKTTEYWDGEQFIISGESAGEWIMAEQPVRWP